ncbi:TadE family protein [Microbacterium sp. MPKO10]|uniref:TadE family protein n=1 Tax=Microbacterium sp. MPKO10 TaxID=2989818 RepID=UPI0022360325|nr:TadE family protein [Microbacterium sp. MPKO10]MCW4458144.1 TadE family protein [Microbacterium sp. MPKO10]
MRLAKRLTDPLTEDRGSASLEFITAGLILLVPLVYLVIALSQIQGGSLAVTGAAKQAARVFVLADDPSVALTRVETAVRVSLADFGVDADEAHVTVTCADGSGAECLRRGEVVTVTVTAAVALPLVPDVLDVRQAASVPVEAHAVQKVSRFWGTP